VFTFLRSFKCLCLDKNEIDLNIILSDSNEVTQFWNEVERIRDEPCPAHIGPTRLTEAERVERRFLPELLVTNLYDILPPQFKEFTLPTDTSALLERGEKYKYQGIKKLASAAHFDYD
jgi:hypothetical protein